MLLGIDHLVIACADPDGAALELEARVGLEASDGGRHATLGTFNRLVWLGDTYLELIGVFDRELAMRSWIGGPTVRAIERGGGLATWAVACDAIEADVARLRAAGSRLGPLATGERRRPDGRLVRWRLAAPPLLGPTEPPFFIEHDPAGAEWTAEDRTLRSAAAHPVGGPVRLETLEIVTADPGQVALHVLRSAGIGPFRPSLAGRGARDATVGRQTIRYRPAGRAGGPVSVPGVTVRLRVLGAPGVSRDVEALGCRFLVAPG